MYFQYILAVLISQQANRIMLCHVKISTEPEHEPSFSVLLVKGRRDVIESTVDFTASHVKWRVSSLSQVGPVIQSSLQVKHNGAVLVYKELKRKYQTDLIFRVFLAPNSDSEIKVMNQNGPTSP